MNRSADRRDDIILLTGSTGQVGHELLHELAPLGRVVAPAREELDVGSPDSIRETVRRSRPSVIVNAAAYTAVDDAETHIDVCTAVNATGPGVLAEEAAAVGALLVHFSTDYVFDGRADSPYTETDHPNPLSVYGRTKLAGEQAIASAMEDYLILRTSWVYGARGRNFLNTIRRLARERPQLRVVSDQIGAPTRSGMVAAATAHALRDILGGRGKSGEGAAPPFGIYHVTSAGRASWYDFAREIISGDPRPQELRCRSVDAITSAEYPTAAPRPAMSLLACDKFRRRFGFNLPDWRDELALVQAELRAGAEAASTAANAGAAR